MRARDNTIRWLCLSVCVMCHIRRYDLSHVTLIHRGRPCPLKLIAFGLYFGEPDAYLRDAWNCMDGFIVVLGIIGKALSGRVRSSTASIANAHAHKFHGKSRVRTHKAGRATSYDVSLKSRN